MKKSILYIIGIFSTCALLLACAKTTKGKVSQTWNATFVSAQGINGSDTLNYTFNIAKNTKENNYKSELTLHKNGSYHQLVTGRYTSPYDSSYHENQLYEVKGYWAFMSSNKSQELKKNEQIKFSPTYFKYTENFDTLNYYETTTDINDLQDMNMELKSIGLVFWLTNVGFIGANHWVIKESTNKKLVLTTIRNFPHNTLWGDFLGYFKTDMEIVLERK